MFLLAATNVRNIFRKNNKTGWKDLFCLSQPALRLRHRHDSRPRVVATAVSMVMTMLMIFSMVLFVSFMVLVFVLLVCLVVCSAACGGGRALSQAAGERAQEPVVVLAAWALYSVISCTLGFLSMEYPFTFFTLPVASVDVPVM